jgi:hypothetical protein
MMLVALAVTVGVGTAGCGGSTDPDASPSASRSAATASASASGSASAAVTAEPTSSPAAPTTDAATPAASGDAGQPEPGVATTTDEGFTCVYADVDGSVTVPCDSEVCITVGCLRSDGIYIGPNADAMNSAAAEATATAGASPDAMEGPVDPMMSAAPVEPVEPTASPDLATLVPSP